MSGLIYSPFAKAADGTVVIDLTTFEMRISSTVPANHSDNPDPVEESAPILNVAFVSKSAVIPDSWLEPGVRLVIEVLPV